MKSLAAAKYGTGVFFPFDTMGLFDNNKVVNGPDDLTDNDVLVVWGGADISPSLYKRAVSRFTGADEQLSHRDAYEWALMTRAKDMGIPIIGVCRGAQMLCALAGGYLIQHVDNHGRSHMATTTDKNFEQIKVSSVHHQMMAPWDVEHVLHAWSSDKLSGVYYDEDKTVEVPCEPELVFFPKVKGLAIQWHPEFMDEKVPATQYVYNLVKEML